MSDQQPNMIEATVFVYRQKYTGQVRCEYIDRARLLEDDPAWEHMATLEPRRWIQAHWEKVQSHE